MQKQLEEGINVPYWESLAPVYIKDLCHYIIDSLCESTSSQINVTHHHTGHTRGGLAGWACTCCTSNIKHKTWCQRLLDGARDRTQHPSTPSQMS